ncbi:unnamed protein product, partial [Polarella glacialis]
MQSAPSKTCPGDEFASPRSEDAGDPQPIMVLGFALVGLGSVGLMGQLLPLLLRVPLAAWMSLALLLLGFAALFVDEFLRLLKDGTLHELPGKFIQRQMQ